MLDFENTKSSIVSSALGVARGMSSTTKWNDVVELIESTPAYTSGGIEFWHRSDKTAYGIDTKYGAWAYPSSGYYTKDAYIQIPWDLVSGLLGDVNTSGVLQGSTFSSKYGVKLTGTMKSHTSGGTAGTNFGVDNNDGAWLYIPENGYYSTGAWVNIPISGLKTKLGTAAQASVLTGSTFSSSVGVRASGTMKDYSSTIQTATTSGSDNTKSCYRINNGYIEICPAKGYWGWTAWDKSCIRIPVSTATTVTTSIAYSGSNLIEQPDYEDGTVTGTYVSKTYINFALFSKVNVSVNLHGGSNAYGHGGWGTVECCVKNSSGTVVKSESKTGDGTESKGSPFEGTFTVDVSSFNEVGWIHCNLSCNGGYAWKPNNNGKTRYTGHAEITGITLS